MTRILGDQRIADEFCDLLPERSWAGRTEVLLADSIFLTSNLDSISMKVYFPETKLHVLKELQNGRVEGGNLC